jgi:CRP-like cAMP-binding protein
MSQNKFATASFSVNTESLHALGLRDPYSKQSLELYHSGKLSANERLYFSLWGSSELSTSLIRAKTRFARQGDPVSSAYFVIKGHVLGVQGEEIYRLGPGSVIGLAEGVGGLPYIMDAIAVNDVQVRVFPIYVISKLVKNMPPGLKGMLKSTVMRTLQLSSPPPLLP